MFPNLHILGIQGCGKGTQAELLVKRFNLSYIGAGELLRERASQDDSLAIELKQIINQGKLVPDKVVATCLKDKLNQTKISVGMLGDGILRDYSQIEVFKPIWTQFNLDSPLILHLALDEETAFNRILNRIKESGKQARPDDNPEAIRARFKIYHDRTKKVLEYFEKQDQIITIDASQSIEAIFKDLEKAVIEYYPKLLKNGAN